MAAADAPAGRVDLRAVPYAGIATRAIALAVDVIIAQALALLGFGVLAVIATLVSSVHFDTAEKLIAAAGWALSVSIYFVAFWSLTGQTPGMQLMRIRVTDADGNPPSVVHSIVRGIGLICCIIPLFLGFVTVLFDNRRRGAHDMIAGTVVVYSEPG
jgi:uncharacterized RDD family membrane protein YckC